MRLRRVGEGAKQAAKAVRSNGSTIAERNYGTVAATTVDWCGRCGAAGTRGVHLVVPDDRDRLRPALVLCGACALEVAGDVARMVAGGLRVGRR